MAGPSGALLAACALLPAAALLAGRRHQDGKRDLAFMHVPYNFGHTIEGVALMKKGVSGTTIGTWSFMNLGGFGNHEASAQSVWQKIMKVKREGGIPWGHFNPDLHVKSNATGCSLYYSPQKHWPRDVAAAYFGDKKVFGVLRDPYEKLVAMFRGAVHLGLIHEEYGDIFNRKYVPTCDVNGAIKEAMKKYIDSKDPFVGACAFLPTADYFEGPYGISVPVDARLIPDSINQIFADHGYPEMFIGPRQVMHVMACSEVWAGDLDNETRSLVKQVYARDFELLCKHFGYCDQEENACIHNVPHMCPRRECARSKCASD